MHFTFSFDVLMVNHAVILEAIDLINGKPSIL